MVFEDAYKGITDDSLKTILDLSTDYYISVDDTAGHSGELSKRQELAKKNFKKLTNKISFIEKAKKAKKEAEEKAEAERRAAEKAEAERLAAEKAQQDAEKAEAERLAAEKAQQDAEKAEAEKKKEEDNARKMVEKAQQDAEKAEVERLSAEKAQQDALEQEISNTENQALENAISVAKEKEKEAKLAAEKAYSDAKATEEARQNAEANAQAAREARQKSESEAQAAEEARLKAESEAQAAEKAQQDAEAARIAAEAEAAEAAEAEQARIVTAEKAQQDAEAARIAAEAEQARIVTAEEAEKAQQDAEQVQRNAEGEKAEKLAAEEEAAEAAEAAEEARQKAEEVRANFQNAVKGINRLSQFIENTQEEVERIKAEQGKFYDKMKENIKIKYNNIITNPHSENIIQDIYLESIKFIEELLKDKYEIFKGLKMYDENDEWIGFMRINNGEYTTQITVKEFYKILIYFVEILINEKIKMITESEGGEKEKVARIENYSLFIDIVDYILYIGFLGNRINSEDPLNKGMLNEVEIEDKMKDESYLTTQTKRDNFFSNMKKEKFHFVHLLRYLEIRSKKHEIENSYIGDSMKRQLHIRTIAKFIFERYVKKPKYS